MSTTLTLSQPATLHQTRRLSLTSVFTRIFDGVREGHAIEARYDALAAMSNAELARRGLTRADITQAALAGGTG